MRFQVNFTPSADRDLKYLQVYEQRVVIVAIQSFLREDADVEGNRKKRLRPNELAPWELRAAEVKVVAIGYKEHNELLIRGRKMEL